MIYVFTISSLQKLKKEHPPVDLRWQKRRAEKKYHPEGIDLNRCLNTLTISPPLKSQKAGSDAALKTNNTLKWIAFLQLYNYHVFHLAFLRVSKLIQMSKNPNSR